MAIVLQQSGFDTSGPAATVLNSWIVDWSASPNKGSFLALGVVSRVDDTAPTVPGVAVSHPGVSWTFVSRETSATGGGQFGVVLDVYFGIVDSLSVGSQTFISYTTVPSLGCAVFAEYTGINNASPLDASFDRNGTASPILAGPTAFTVQNNELWLAFWCSENTQNIPQGATNGFAVIASGALGVPVGLPDVPGEPSIGLGALVVTSRGNASSDATTVGNDREASIMVTYKAGGPSEFPSAPVPSVGNSIPKNDNYVEQGLDRLAEQFKSGK